MGSMLVEQYQAAARNADQIAAENLAENVE
jgi:hypothetical protein